MNLTGQKVQSTYQLLTISEDGYNFTNGTGSALTNINITSSFSNTASLALTVQSSSYAATSSLLLGAIQSASYALSASNAFTSSNSISTSYCINNQERTRIYQTPNYMGQIVYQQNFDSLSNFTTTAGTMSYDTVNYMSSTASINFSGSVGTTRVITINTPGLTASNCQLSFRIYVYSGSLSQSFQNIQVVYVNLTDTNNKLRQYQIFNPTSTSSSLAGNGAGWGWYNYSNVLEDPDFSNDAGAFNFNIKKIDFGCDVTLASSTPSVTFDQFTIFKPINNKGLIWLFTDGTYANMWQYAAYLKSLPLTTSNVTNVNPTLCATTNITYVDIANHLSSSQVAALAQQGHDIGIYGQGVDALLWVSKSDAQKLSNIQVGQDYLFKNGIPPAKVLSIAGSSGWTYTDEVNYLGKYFNGVVAGGNYAGRTVVHGVGGNIRNLCYANFVPANPLLNISSSVNTSSNQLVLGQTVNWVNIHPIKFTGVVPTTVPQIQVNSIYWYTGSNATGSIYTSATNAISQANAIVFNDTGSGQIIVTSNDNQYFGQRVFALVKSKGVFVQGAHCSGVNDLTTGLFELDALASLVNNGEAQFVSTNELLTGQNISTNRISSSYSITSSVAINALNFSGSISSASYAGTSSLLLGSVQSSSYSTTSSFALNVIPITAVTQSIYSTSSLNSTSASWASSSISSSYSTTSSFALSYIAPTNVQFSTQSIYSTSSLSSTSASYASSSISSSYLNSISNADVPLFDDINQASYTLTQSLDANRVLTFVTNSTVICPATFPRGWNCVCIQSGSGIVSFVTSSGAKLYNRQSQYRTAGQYAITTLMVFVTNNTSASYILGGDTQT